MPLKKLGDNPTLEELREFYVEAHNEYDTLETSVTPLKTRISQLEESNQKLFLKATATLKQTKEEEEEEEFKSKLISDETLKSLDEEDLKILQELEESLNE